MSIKILAIESSCDETAASIVECEKESVRIVANNVSSQVKLHAKWGGVVPNLAAREHVKNFPLIISQTLKEARISPSEIDLISVVNGPGLIPALLTGLTFAKTLSYLWEKPLIGVHHIEGHIYANFIKEKTDQQKSSSLLNNSKNGPLFPVLALVVSGGHTQLIYMKNHLEYEIIGETLDDAAGEAFDKVARILNIGYPGGPLVSKRAEQAKKEHKITFPRPMQNSKDLNFSFSGLKTAVLYETKENENLLGNDSYINDVCAEFQEAVTEVLVNKSMKAVKKYSPKTLLLAGGVSANKQLREKLGWAIESYTPKINYLMPDLSLTGDNAAMIGAAACFKWKSINNKDKNDAKNGWKNLKADANLKLS